MAKGGVNRGERGEGKLKEKRVLWKSDISASANLRLASLQPPSDPDRTPTEPLPPYI